MAVTLRALALALAVAAVPAADAAAAAELRVGAAASLWQAAAEIARAFERHEGSGAKVRLVYAASSQLAAQVDAGAPLDVLLSADPRWVEELAARGRVEPESARAFARNRLVVLAAPGVRLARPEDLAGPAVRRFALPHDAVPLGRYASAWLAARGLLAPLEPRLVRSEHARATLVAVELGHADAALVYATDALLARRARIAFEIPEAEQPSVAYVAARVRGSPRAGLADRFLDFLAAPAARAALRRAGFLPPGPEPEP